ncbi:hypothetical protein VTL71DRAFT_2798 [Oculimacula yallundae]|uniref:Uncharacterized protein n=1 Tax=Oculimacula yallundae TaxID=86028 RepID=A0ABR4CB93_9HELO
MDTRRRKLVNNDALNTNIKVSSPLTDFPHLDSNVVVHANTGADLQCSDDASVGPKPDELLGSASLRPCPESSDHRTISFKSHSLIFCHPSKHQNSDILELLSRGITPGWSQQDINQRHELAANLELHAN